MAIPGSNISIVQIEEMSKPDDGTDEQKEGPPILISFNLRNLAWYYVKAHFVCVWSLKYLVTSFYLQMGSYKEAVVACYHGLTLTCTWRD